MTKSREYTEKEVFLNDAVWSGFSEEQAFLLRDHFKNKPSPKMSEEDIAEVLLNKKFIKDE